MSYCSCLYHIVQSVCVHVFVSLSIGLVLSMHLGVKQDAVTITASGTYHRHFDGYLEPLKGV